MELTPDLRTAMIENAISDIESILYEAGLALECSPPIYFEPGSIIDIDETYEDMFFGWSLNRIVEHYDAISLKFIDRAQLVYFYDELKRSFEVPDSTAHDIAGTQREDLIRFRTLLRNELIQ